MSASVSGSGGRTFPRAAGPRPARIAATPGPSIAEPGNTPASSEVRAAPRGWGVAGETAETEPGVDGRTGAEGSMGGRRTAPEHRSSAGRWASLPAPVGHGACLVAGGGPTGPHYRVSAGTRPHKPSLPSHVTASAGSSRRDGGGGGEPGVGLGVEPHAPSVRQRLGGSGTAPKLPAIDRVLDRVPVRVVDQRSHRWTARWPPWRHAERERLPCGVRSMTFQATPRRVGSKARSVSW